MIGKYIGKIRVKLKVGVGEVVLNARALVARLYVWLVALPFGFEGWIWVLIASVPDLCIRLTFTSMMNN